MHIGLLMYDTRLPKDLDVAYIPSGGIYIDDNGAIFAKTVMYIPAPQVHDAFIRQRDSMNVPSYTPYDERNESWRRTFAVCAAMFRDIVSERHL